MTEWQNENVDDLPENFFEDLPEAVFWRIIVMPLKPTTVSKGGIVLTSSNQEAQEYNTYAGKVVSLGPLVGKRPPLSDAELGVELGDWLIFGKHAGQRIHYKGVKLLVINDEDILALTSDPDTLRVTI